MMKRERVNWELTPERVALFKSIFVDGAETYMESSYGGHRFCFPVTKECDAQMRIEQPDLFLTNGICSTFTEYLRFIVQTHPIDPGFIAKHNIEDWQIRLLRRSNFDYDSDVGQLLYLGFKRPWGNSSVLGDVLEEMRIDVQSDYTDVDIAFHYEKYINVAVEVIRLFLVEHPFDPMLQGTSDGYRYEMSESYLRKLRIKQIINE